MDQVLVNAYCVIAAIAYANSTPFHAGYVQSMRRHRCYSISRRCPLSCHLGPAQRSMHCHSGLARRFVCP